MGRQYVNAKDELCQGYEQRYKVVDLVVHPQFNKRHLTNDIAVMWIRSEKYNQTVRYSDQVLPVCLPELSNPMEEFYNNGDFGIVSGWGLLNETDNKGSNSLQHVALPMLSPDKCLEAYGRFVDMDENKQVKVAKSQKVFAYCLPNFRNELTKKSLSEFTRTMLFQSLALHINCFDLLKSITV